MQLLCLGGIRITCSNVVGNGEGKKSHRFRLGCIVNMNFVLDMIELKLAASGGML
jgi:hypothetical protein